MYKKPIENKQADLEKVISYLKEELGKIRTGRANPSLVENIMVDYYGDKTPLKQVANISVPEPRLLVISPWSEDSLANIEAAIKLADTDLNPDNDGKVIRINIPALNEERRKALVKLLNQKAEEARISIRTIRDDIWKEIKTMEAEKQIDEDDKYRGKERLEENIASYNKQIEELREKKEKEVMTV